MNIYSSGHFSWPGGLAKINALFDQLSFFPSSIFDHLMEWSLGSVVSCPAVLEVFVAESLTVSPLKAIQGDRIRALFASPSQQPPRDPPIKSAPARPNPGTQDHHINYNSEIEERESPCYLLKAFIASHYNIFSDLLNHTYRSGSQLRRIMSRPHRHRRNLSNKKRNTKRRK